MMNKDMNKDTNLNAQEPKKKGGCLKSFVIAGALIIGGIAFIGSGEESATPETVTIEPPQEQTEEKVEPVKAEPKESEPVEKAEPVVDQSKLSADYSIGLFDFADKMSKNLENVGGIYTEMGNDVMLFMDEDYVAYANGEIDAFQAYLMGIKLEPQTEADHEMQAILAEIVKYQMLANDHGKRGINEIDADVLTTGVEYQLQANEKLGEMTTRAMDMIN